MNLTLRRLGLIVALVCVCHASNGSQIDGTGSTGTIFNAPLSAPRAIIFTLGPDDLALNTFTIYLKRNNDGNSQLTLAIWSANSQSGPETMIESHTEDVTVSTDYSPYTFDVSNKITTKLTTGNTYAFVVSSSDPNMKVKLFSNVDDYVSTNDLTNVVAYYDTNDWSKSSYTYSVKLEFDPYIVASPTPTVSATQSSTVSSTSTSTSTSTASSTPTSTFTSTSTPTSTSSSTSTSTASSTPTSTFTSTSTPTSTSSSTSTSTASSTPTSTSTSTSTASSTPTSTSTSTASSTSTSTSTSTATSTSSSTSTSTASATSTSTSTSTATSTSTSTPSATPSMSASASSTVEQLSNNSIQSSRSGTDVATLTVSVGLLIGAAVGGVGIILFRRRRQHRPSQV